MFLSSTRFFFLLLFITGLLFSCKEMPLSTQPQKVVAGFETWNHPAVGLLYMGRATCTGTLISPKVVLTAAHCLDKDAILAGSFQFIVTLQSSHDQSLQTITRFVDETLVFQNSGYFTSETLDLGVVVLKKPIWEIEPIPFRTKKLDESFVGKKVMVLGYGRMSNQSSTKRYYEPRIVGLRIQVNFSNRSGGHNLVVSHPFQTIFYGDSGGPVLLQSNGKPVIVGVNSRKGFSGHTNPGPEITTLVGQNAAWIQNIVSQQGTDCQKDEDCGSCAQCKDSFCARASTVSAPVCQKQEDCNSGNCFVTLEKEQKGESISRCFPTCKDSSCCPNGSYCSVVNGKSVCVPYNKAFYDCSSFCKQNEDCLATEECVEGTCQLKEKKAPTTTCETCDKNEDCGNQSFCEKAANQKQGFCLVRCSTDHLCPQGFYCKATYPDLHLCLPVQECQITCQKETDCPSSKTCKEGKCTSPNKAKVGDVCSSNNPCSNEGLCALSFWMPSCMPRCTSGADTDDKKGKEGFACLAGKLCDEGLQCQTLSQGNERCVRSCRDKDCPYPLTCDSKEKICVCDQANDCNGGLVCTSSSPDKNKICQALSCPSGTECLNASFLEVGVSACFPTDKNAGFGTGRTCDDYHKCLPQLECFAFHQEVPVKICQKSCQSNSDCPYSRLCVTHSSLNNLCHPQLEKQACNAVTPCAPGNTCQQGKCTSQETPLEAKEETTKEEKIPTTCFAFEFKNLDASVEKKREKEESTLPEKVQETLVPEQTKIEKTLEKEELTTSKGCGCHSSQPPYLSHLSFFLFFFLWSFRQKRKERFLALKQ